MLLQAATTCLFISVLWHVQQSWLQITASILLRLLAYTHSKHETLPSVGLMLVYSLQRQTNINPTLVERLVFAGAEPRHGK